MLPQLLADDRRLNPSDRAGECSTIDWKPWLTNLSLLQGIEGVPHIQQDANPAAWVRLSPAAMHAQPLGVGHEFCMSKQHLAC